MDLDFDFEIDFKDIKIKDDMWDIKDLSYKFDYNNKFGCYLKLTGEEAYKRCGMRPIFDFILFGMEADFVEKTIDIRTYVPGIKPFKITNVDFSMLPKHVRDGLIIQEI